jgi:hypothetical protein
MDPEVLILVESKAKNVDGSSVTEGETGSNCGKIVQAEHLEDVLFLIVPMKLLMVDIYGYKVDPIIISNISLLYADHATVIIMTVGVSYVDEIQRELLT